MFNNRSYLDIIAEILRIARTGASKSRIVFRANINFKMLREYTEKLAKVGLMRKEGRLFKTTEKGSEYLEHYRNLKRVGGNLLG